LNRKGWNINKKRDQINKDIDFIDEELEELQNTVDRSMGSNLKADKQRLSKVSESKKNDEDNVHRILREEQACGMEVVVGHQGRC